MTDHGLNWWTQNWVAHIHYVCWKVTCYGWNGDYRLKYHIFTIWSLKVLKLFYLGEQSFKCTSYDNLCNDADVCMSCQLVFCVCVCVCMCVCVCVCVCVCELVELLSGNLIRGNLIYIVLCLIPTSASIELAYLKCVGTHKSALRKWVAGYKIAQTGPFQDLASPASVHDFSVLSQNHESFHWGF